MGADLFESFVGSIIAAVTLANGDRALVMLPLWVAGSGILASMVGYFAVGLRDSEKATNKQLLWALHKGTIASSITVILLSIIPVTQLFKGRETDGYVTHSYWD